MESFGNFEGVGIFGNFENFQFWHIIKFPKFPNIPGGNLPLSKFPGILHPYSEGLTIWFDAVGTLLYRTVRASKSTSTGAPLQEKKNTDGRKN